MAFSSNRFSAVLTLAFALGIFAPLDAAAAALQCNMSSAKIKSGTGRTTSLTDFTGVTSINFRQGGSAGGCIVVQFSAEAGVDTGGFLQIRVLLDGIAQTDFNFADTSSASHAIMFPIAGVFPGAHTVKIAMRSVTGGAVGIQQYALAVFHVP